MTKLDRLGRNLRDVHAVLAQIGVPYWLDSGTLLGAIRDGRMIEWDNDVDLGVLARESDRIEQARTVFRARGFAYSVSVHRRRVEQIELRRDQASINISVYHAEGDLARTRLVIPNTTLARRHLDALRNSERSILHAAYRRIVDTLRRVLPTRWISAWVFRDRVLHRRVPLRHFESLGKGTLLGLEFSVPSDVEAYLALRYGSDWRIPRRDWIYWQDDGALEGDDRS